METIDLLNKTPEEMMTLIRSEIAIINSIKPVVTEEVYIENKETKRREKIIVKSSDLILKALMEKRETNTTSRVYDFEFDDVLSYSEANDYNLVKVKDKFIKTVKHSKKYIEYREEIKEIFEDENFDGMLSYFLKHDRLMLIIEFSLKNIQKDNDNVTKPFVDCLFFNVDKNDNAVKRIYSSVKKSEINKDTVSFQLVKLKHSDWEKGIFIQDCEYEKDDYFYDSPF